MGSRPEKKHNSLQTTGPTDARVYRGNLVSVPVGRKRVLPSSRDMRPHEQAANCSHIILLFPVSFLFKDVFLF